MPLKFLHEFGIEKEIEWQRLEINFSAPNRLEIVVPRLLAAEKIGKLLYSIYNKLNYLFNYLDYQVVVQETMAIDVNVIKEYFSFICATPFLWKNKGDLIFLSQRKGTLKDFAFRRNVVYLYFPDQITLNEWKPKLIGLKKILARLGLTSIRFASREKEKEKNLVKNVKDSNNLINRRNNGIETKQLKNNSNSPLNNSSITSRKKLTKSFLLREWKERKLFELGIHTKFSTLDGISSPADYAASAQRKNYAALAITDHYNVQSFPEFSNCQNSDLKIIYGCEMEMLEDDLPPYIFNHSQSILEADINDLTYCVFDLETTGFFSEYNEIIEIGYVIYHRGETIREGEYLICPEKEIPHEILATWYTNIDPQELKKSPTIKEILPTLRQEWENCVLVAHNAGKFDYGFLNKVWKEHLGEELPYPVLDTLPLSWILFPERKSYSLEKLSHVPGRAKIIQTHRALDDSKLLAELLEKLLKTLKENKISQWGEVKETIKKNFFPNRGYKIKVLATSQEGLHNLYRLITLSHTERLFKKPSVFRSDLVKYRPGLLIGAAGGREGETFFLFSSFNFEKRKREKLRFYDYIEVNSPPTFRYLWLNGQIGENELKEMLKKIISTAEELKIPAITSHHVYYCESKERLLKEIIVANEGMNGSRHYLYNHATLDDKEDRFAYLPPQHLLNLEEMIDNWLFLNDKQLIEKIIFRYPQQIVNKIGEVNIQQPPLNYSATGSSSNEEHDLISAYTQRATEIFGNHWPDFVQQRIAREWQIIKGRYVFIYWLAYKIVQKTHEDGSIVGSRGSIGSSFIAYLCGITDLNPLPFYQFCQKCRQAQLYQTQDRIYSGYDYREKENCPTCSSLLTMEGHNLPFETFFGWEGEKTPDIDLNFSGEYQKVAHNYVRQLLGEKSVYRIGTINTLSQQTAEIFWKEHLKLRKKLNPDFQEERWFKEWINSEKLSALEKKLSQLRREKSQLETELKKPENQK